MSGLPSKLCASWEVPSFSVVEFLPKRSRICCCIFVINEGGKLHSQLSKMKGLIKTVDVLVADGGSTDGSTTTAQMKAMGVRSLLVKTGAGRLSAQMRMAFFYALRQGYEGVVTIDGNDKDDPKSIPNFVLALENKVAFIQGSRFLPGGREENTPWTRHLAIRILHAPLISLSAGFRYSDTTNGFRGFHRRFLLDPKVALFRDTFSEYELHFYLAIRAPRLGYPVMEIPVSRVYPKTGKVPTKISPIRGNFRILMTLFKACMHVWNP